jgi:hypothetical protein
VEGIDNLDSEEQTFFLAKWGKNELNNEAGSIFTPSLEY